MRSVRGRLVPHVNQRQRQSCECGELATVRCDGVKRGQKLCGVVLCEACAERVDDKDFCWRHASEDDNGECI